MAKITVEFDTVSKQMSASIDGQAIENVVGVDIYKDYYMDDSLKYTCSILTKAEDESNKMTTYTRMSANDANDVDASMTPAKFKGFVQKQIGNPAIQSDINEYFGVK